MQRGRAGIAALLLIALLSGAGTPLHAGTVLILSQTASKLTALDSRTAAVIGSLDLPSAPANMAVSPDGRRLYVAHSDRGEISTVDVASLSVIRSFKAPGEPFGLAVSSAGSLFTGDWASDRIHELNAETGETLRSVAVGKAPAHMALTPDGRQLVVAAREADAVAIVDVATFTVSAKLPVERAPFAVATSHDGRRAAVANTQAGTISIVDLAKRSVVKSTRVGAMPYGVAFTPNDASLFVTNQQSGSVAVVGEASAVTSVKVGSYPEGIAITQDGARAFVANWFSDDVSVIDIAAHKEVGRVKVPAGPRAVLIIPDKVDR